MAIQHLHDIRLPVGTSIIICYEKIAVLAYTFGVPENDKGLENFIGEGSYITNTPIGTGITTNEALFIKEQAKSHIKDYLFLLKFTRHFTTLPDV